MYKNYFKILIDRIIAFCFLLFIFPIFLCLYLLTRLSIGKPSFFIQDRPGYRGKIFKLVKFRTMLNKTDKLGNLLPDEKRLTKFGKTMRSLSLDEVPELINVLIGDMSLVGPRPLITEYLPLYSKEQERRHEVKPGITGWAQVNGRNAISWEEKFKLDVWYVDHISFWLDIKIIFMTIIKIFKREGISQAGHATMEPFTNKNNQRNTNKGNYFEES